MSRDLLELSAESPFCMPQIVRLLQAEPKPRSIAAELAQAHCHIRAHAGFAGQDAMERLTGHPQLACSFADR